VHALDDIDQTMCTDPDMIPWAASVLFGWSFFEGHGFRIDPPGP